MSGSYDTLVGGRRYRLSRFIVCLSLCGIRESREKSFSAVIQGLPTVMLSRFSRSVVLAGQGSATQTMLMRGMASGSPYDVVIIGGGPGGYVAAIKAAQLGLKTACVESRGTLGGTCLNVGCIPSKALLNASHHYHMAKADFEKYGIEGGDGIKINVEKMLGAKQKAVKGLTQGIEGLFKKNKVDYVKGFGKLASPTSVKVALNAGGEETLQAKNIIIATGSEPSTLPGLNVDQKYIVDSTGALDISKVPKHMVVVGGGVIGLELGSVWGRLGAKITVVEYLDRIIPGMDSEIASNFQKILTKQKFKFKLGMKVDSAKVQGESVKLSLSPSKGGATEELDADIVLVATGRRPFTKGLGLEDLGIQMDRLQIKVDDHFRTNVPSVYAIGDCIKGPMLAHKAEEEGIALVETLAGQVGHVNYDAIPGVIYTHPEVAAVGKTEDDLKAAGIPYRKGTFPFMANSRARSNDDADGLVKVLAHKDTDRLLGMHIIGPGAGDMIMEGVIGIEYQASSEDIARACHAHPTFSEAVKEACLATWAKPIHF
eukprot:g11846.t1